MMGTKTKTLKPSHRRYKYVVSISQRLEVHNMCYASIHANKTLTKRCMSIHTIANFVKL